jgi:hypothetical protein
MKTATRNKLMGQLFQCPACGYKHRVQDGWLDKRMKCAACEEVFRLSPDRAIAEPAPKPPPAPVESLGAKLVKKTLGDPAAASDASIPGAMSGILAGVVVSILFGIFSGQNTGETVGGALLGFVIGFGIGAMLGAIFGAVWRRVAGRFESKPSFPGLVSGALVGAVVALVVGGLQWSPVGAGVGALGSLFWGILCRRVEAGAKRPDRLNFQEDEIMRTDLMERRPEGPRPRARKR